MNARLARLLIRLYPGCWRERYGEEFAALLQSHPAELRVFTNVIFSAISEHAFPTQRGTMKTFFTFTKRTSAFLPVVMSLAALSLVLGSIAANLIQNGHIIREVDEGAIAHLWQLLIAGQIPILAFFVFRWLPGFPRQTLQVLALQVAAVLANVAVVFSSGLG